MVHFARMPSPIPRQVCWNLFARTVPTTSAFPRSRGGSAPALVFSRPAQRLLTLRPACSPSRQSDPLHQRLQQFRCLHCCSDCYRVERTSSRAGYSRCGPPPFHGAPGNPTSHSPRPQFLARNNVYLRHRLTSREELRTCQTKSGSKHLKTAEE
jgi:hypothetical protein